MDLRISSSSNSKGVIESNKQKIYKNFGVLCLTFLGVFTSYQAVSGLQSSGVTDKSSDAVLPQITVYISLVISALFFTDIVINRLGTKWTLVLCQVPYALYICASYYPHLAITVPLALLLGVSAAPLWTAKCVYLCHLAERYAMLFKTNLNHAYSSFFGCFFMVFLSTGVWGNLIYYLVFSISTKGREELYIPWSHENCGIEFDYHETEDSPSWSIGSKFTLISTYLCIALGSILLLAIYVDSMRGEDGSTSLITSLTKTLRLSIDSKQIALIPLTMWSGIEQAFFMSVFAESFIVCYYGFASRYGQMLVLFGLAASLSSIIFGLLRSKLPLITMFGCAALLNYAVFVLCFYFHNNLVVTFSCVVMWGIAEGIWQPQIGALYAELNPSEQVAAFSNYRLWESAGYIIVFSLKLWTVYVSIIIYVLAALLTIGLAGYLVIVLLYKIKASNEISPNVNDQVQTS